MGVSSVYLMDVLAASALLVTVHMWGPLAFSESRLRWFRAVAVGLAAASAQAVYRGIEAGYPDPLKGGILGLYPLLGWFAATWFLTRPVEEPRRWRWVLYVPTLGVLLAWVVHTPMIVAASGLYLAIAAAFGVQMRYTGNSRLLLWTLTGAILLTALASKRGPLLAVGAAIFATAVAGRPSRRRVIRWPVISWTLATLGVLALLSFSISGRTLSDIPVAGGLMTRLLSSADVYTEAGANVGLRLEMWREALRLAWQEPLFGAGAGHPIEVDAFGPRANSGNSGPHNSFVGYIFYLGWPAGLGFILLVAATLRRTWRARHHPVAASWFGATVGVCVTAFTNVAFETTFIGLPSWLVLSCAYALVGVDRRDEGENRTGPEDTERRKRLIARRPPGPGGATGRSTARSPDAPTSVLPA
ncbi:O-antigen ligase family protein [Streptomyces afghaniensis]|uniref:O-antigen ligase family protein n=1 Tax=Streptomyces afghaniensis TaxID=66865 RepID=UPI0027D8E9D1|nr:O-antigen ligase family protein [Streptomyces afghaniensis]